MMLYKIQKNRTVVFLLYFIIFSVFLHSSIKICQDSFKLLDYFMINSGCRLEKITVHGSNMILDSEIYNITKPFIGSNTFFLPLGKIQRLIAKNPWCKNITVIKKLPNEIVVRLEEHKAFGVVNDESIINSKLSPIVDYDRELHANLELLLIDSDNLCDSENFINELRNFPEIFSNIRRIECISNRRWNIILKNGSQLKLPGNNLRKTLIKIKRLYDNGKIFSSNYVKAVDFRIPEKMFI